MSRSAFVNCPTALALALSGATGRPAIFKSVPTMSSNGRPINPAASAKASMRRAIEAFNRG